MNNNVLIHQMFLDVEAGKFEKANALLADNFRTTILGKVVNKPDYISAFQALLKGFPDLKINFLSMQSEGSKMIATLKLSGTNSRDIPAVTDSWHTIPATFMKIDGMIMNLEILFKDDKIEQITNAPDSHGLFAKVMQHLNSNTKSSATSSFIM